MGKPQSYFYRRNRQSTSKGNVRLQCCAILHYLRQSKLQLFFEKSPLRFTNRICCAQLYQNGGIIKLGDSKAVNYMEEIRSALNCTIGTAAEADAKVPADTPALATNVFTLEEDF